MIRSSGMKLPFARAFIFPLAALFFAAPSVHADKYPRQAGLDVRHYIFRIALNDANEEISGSATLEIRFLEDDIARVSLDLASASGGKGMTVSSVTCLGAPVPFSHASNRLTLTLLPPPKAGDRRQFTVEYHGVPADGLHIGKNKFGERTFFSNNWPDLARQWLPTIDHPYDKASSEFLITAPAKYQVVANGFLEEEEDLDGGLRMTHWNQPEPIATWLNNIGVARFSARHFGAAAGIPLQTWVFPQDRGAGILTFDEPVRHSIEFFQDRIGPYPYRKLASVQATSFGGGMENASAIFYGEKAVTGRAAFGLVSHEVAHQWFGDSVTEKDWDDVWLSEGFATYFSLLAVEHYDGRDAFVDGLKARRTQIFDAEKQLPGIAVVQTQPWDGIPNAIVYLKGGWSLHLLRGLIGTERFWAGIREYYRRYRDANASTADFEQVMEETSGMDLGWFFRQWLFRPGSPVLGGGWKYDPATKTIAIHLLQQQPGDAYRLPLEIGVFFPDGAVKQVEKIELDRKEQQFEIKTDKEPSQVVLDPNTWMLFEDHFAGRH